MIQLCSCVYHSQAGQVLKYHPIIYIVAIDYFTIAKEAPKNENTSPYIHIQNKTLVRLAFNIYHLDVLEATSNP